MDILFLEEFVVEAVIGVHQWEQALKQPLTFDIEIATDCLKVAEQDSLEHAVDYTRVLDFIRFWNEDHRYHLLESLAATLADDLMQEFQFSGLKLRVRKPQTVRGLKSVGVTIYRGKMKPH